METAAQNKKDKSKVWGSRITAADFFQKRMAGVDMRLDFYKFFGYASRLNYIWWLLELNAVILLINLPLMFVFFFMEVSLWMLPVLFITGFSIGPSLMAAFEAMPYIEDGIVKHYFEYLKKNWKKSLMMWALIWTLIMVLVADILILEIYGVMRPLKWCMVVGILFVTSFTLNFFLVWAQWGQNKKDAILLTCKLSFVKPIRFHLDVLILLGTVVLLGQKPIYLFLYGIAVGLFLIYKNFQPIAKFVNERPENQAQNICAK